jgi:hypothetical protein
VNGNVVPAEPGWVLVRVTNGGTYPVVAWLPVDRIEGGTRVQQLWPVAMHRDPVPEAVSPQEMERAGLYLEKEGGS